MKMKLALTTATAMGLLMGAAWAGNSNKTAASQNGLNNGILVKQNGSGNGAGTPAYSNFFLRQNGNNNGIDIEQNGDNQQVGIDNNINYGNGHRAGFGMPAALDAKVGTPPWPRNSGVLQSGSFNSITVRQTDKAPGTGQGNTVVTVKQESSVGATESANILSVTQGNGGALAHNLVGDVYQRNTGGAANRATISQTGGGYDLGNRILIVTQDGIENNLGITQSGNLNILYSSEQMGALNKVTVTQTGGNRNYVALAHQVGNINDIAITQTGSDNDAGSVTQDGNLNSATVTQIGSSNVVVKVDQDGDGNSAYASFTGSSNGVGSFSGEALSIGLNQGTIVQNSHSLSGNNLTYNVNGSSNLFAFNQDGGNNTITGSVGTLASASNSNQVAISQVGNNNVSSFTQYGSGNNLGVSQ